ncbi:hypothetical protein Ciccas_007108 [Cichlidogyrus casuarinus]|uniref:Uncharacterized protein n=1 Tax=Cichlidogyrus casuarinus TaxID=1844966 RepID=A0ABD2Q6D6_9PLAT
MTISRVTSIRSATCSPIRKRHQPTLAPVYSKNDLLYKLLCGFVDVKTAKRKYSSLYREWTGWRSSLDEQRATSPDSTSQDLAISN